MNIIVFEDDGIGQLFPITTGRPAYAITCGGYRLVDMLAELEGRAVGIVRPYLETIQLHDFPIFQQLDLRFPLTLLLNARLVPSISNWTRILEFKDAAIGNSLAQSTGVVARCTGSVIAGVIPTQLLADLNDDRRRKLIAGLNDPTKSSAQTVETELDVFRYPHDVVAQHQQTIAANLQRRADRGNYQQPQPGVFLAEGVRVGAYVVFDATAGPIVVESGAEIGPFSLLRGPMDIGTNSKICERASLKGHVSIAHTCKIGGEVEASVIEPYSNKQHHGFLGHSYLGSWINLGAGTCNSDLKNTYGTVNAQYGERKFPTGMQFFGCVIGDYAKTAINTSIFTGKMIGTASMVYGFATSNVPSFVNYARSFGAMGILPPAVIVETQRRMFARRNTIQRPCDIQLIHEMYRVTCPERPPGLSEEILSL